MYKWSKVIVLVLLVLVVASILRNAPVLANTGAPLPPTPWTIANTGAPLPPTPWAVANTGAPLPPTPWKQ
jgi:hypothetical protein